jgi:hypothetical protein
VPVTYQPLHMMIQQQGIQWLTACDAPYENRAAWHWLVEGDVLRGSAPSELIPEPLRRRPLVAGGLVVSN